MAQAGKDGNFVSSLLALSTSTASPLALTAIPITGVNPLTVAIVDGSGSQITSFGGGTQYTDAGTPPAHPIAPTLVFDNSGSWLHVSAANGLPVNVVAGGAGGGIVTQATGTNLHMVMDSGTLTSITNALPAGTNLLGKVSTDQTSHGTSDLVAADITKIAGGAITSTNVAITDAPLNQGAQAVSSENTAVTATRKVQLVADLVGKLITLPYANPENFVYGTTSAITDTTTTSVIAAQGAGIRTYITAVIVTNSHATVGTFVKITDGASTILWEGYAAAAGGGFTTTFTVPLRGTANTAVNAICVTTGANVIVSANGYKGV